MNCSVIIPAGGVGKRFGSDLPKQFIELDGIPVIIHTLRVFDNLEEITSIIVSVHSEWYNYTRELINKFEIKKVAEVVIGGIERQDSVANALHTKTIDESDIVLVHDAVRPFVSAELVKQIIEEAEETGAAIPVIKTKDTIKEITNKGTIVKTLDRNKLCQVQTPQGFWVDVIKNAYSQAAKASYMGSDSAQLVEFSGIKVSGIDGEDTNFKITTPFDLKVGKMILEERK